MPWYVPVFLRVLVAHGLYPWISKLVVMKHSKQKRHLLNFSFCALVAWLLLLHSGQLSLGWTTTAFIFGVGIANGWASYCQWQAVGLSLSRNSLFTFWDDIIAMTLSYFILQESRFLNWGSGLGIALSLLAVICFAWRDYRKKAAPQKPVSNDQGTRPSLPRRFYGYVFFYSVVWGVATFLMRKWGVEEVPVRHFLVAWYSGAWTGSLTIFLYVKWRQRSKPVLEPPFGKRDFGYVILMGSCVMGALALGYLSYARTPQTVVQPIFLVSEMALPVLIGLFGFRERQGFALVDWLLIGLGVAGGVLAGWSYQG